MREFPFTTCQLVDDDCEVDFNTVTSPSVSVCVLGSGQLNAACFAVVVLRFSERRAASAAETRLESDIGTKLLLKPFAIAVVWSCWCLLPPRAATKLARSILRTTAAQHDLVLRPDCRKCSPPRLPLRRPCAHCVLLSPCPNSLPFRFLLCAPSRSPSPWTGSGRGYRHCSVDHQRGKIQQPVCFPLRAVRNVDLDLAKRESTCTLHKYQQVSIHSRRVRCSEHKQTFCTLMWTNRENLGLNRGLCFICPSLDFLCSGEPNSHPTPFIALTCTLSTALVRFGARWQRETCWRFTGDSLSAAPAISVAISGPSPWTCPPAQTPKLLLFYFTLRTYLNAVFSLKATPQVFQAKS